MTLWHTTIFLMVAMPTKKFQIINTFIRKHLELQHRTQTRQENLASLSSQGGGALAAKGSAKGGGKSKEEGTSPEFVLAGQCRSWVESGNCFKREDCPYEHDPAMRGRLRADTPTAKGKNKGKGRARGRGGDSPKWDRPPSAGKEPPCKFHLKGSC